MKSPRITGLKLLLGIAAMIMAVNIHATDVTRKETLLTHSLSYVPGLIAESIDLGDFYTEASVELYFTADSNGNAGKIRVKSFKANERAGYSKKELKCARKILEAGCIFIIKEAYWPLGENACTILWKQSQREDYEMPMNYTQANASYLGKGFKDSKMQELEANGSGYILVEFDDEGKVCDTKYLGCIIWRMKEYRTANIENLKINHNGSFYNGTYTENGTITGMRVHNGNDIEHEKRVRDIRHIIKRYTEKRTDEIRSAAVPTLSGKEICFEVNVCGVNGAVEMNAPYFPGGKDALTDYIKKMLKSDKEIQNCKPEGSVTVYFKIGTDGTTSGTEIDRKSLERLTFAEGHKKARAIKAVRKAVHRLVEEMPRWTPGRRNGINNENICTIEIEFEDIYTE